MEIGSARFGTRESKVVGLADGKDGSAIDHSREGEGGSLEADEEFRMSAGHPCRGM